MKILLYSIIAIIVLGAAILFSVQNAGTVTLWFYDWKFTASLALVVFLAMIAGAVIAALLFVSLRLSRSVRRRASGKVQKSQNSFSSTTEGQDSSTKAP